MDEIKVDTREAPCPVAEANIRVDCRGETCPVPLVETRKALRKASPGDIIEVVGTHPASKKEIPMAVEALQLELLSVEGSDTDWKIRIQR
jgi:tRNA 2-thiouridine synthesizing protein A